MLSVLLTVHLDMLDVARVGPQVDVCSIEEIDTIARLPNAVPASAGMELNMDGLLSSMWSKMALVRIYTKRVGASLEACIGWHSHVQTQYS